MVRIATFVFAALLCFAPARAALDPFDPLAGQETSSQELEPYRERVYELSRLLGGLHGLRALCAAPDAGEFRWAMLQLLDAEAGVEPGERAALAAAFNAGYRDERERAGACGVEAVQGEAELRRSAARLTDALLASNGG